MRPEDPDVLVDELDATEVELYELRGFYDEEVRLCKVLTDELVQVEKENAALHDAFWAARAADRRHVTKLRDQIDALEARAFAESKRGRWIGVALGATFLLGGYVGFIMGCAT